jgi:hypothetical protein
MSFRFRRLRDDKCFRSSEFATLVNMLRLIDWYVFRLAESVSSVGNFLPHDAQMRARRPARLAFGIGVTLIDGPHSVSKSHVPFLPSTGFPAPMR